MRLKVEIKPSELDREAVGLEHGSYLDDFIVKVWSEGKELVEFNMHLMENELLSCFDQIWEKAKEEVLKKIKE